MNKEKDFIAQYTLARFIEEKIHYYLSQLEEQSAKDLYDLVLSETEKGLLKAIMHKSANNQSKAANMLGLARGTLSKKLKEYQLI